LEPMLKYITPSGASSRNILISWWKRSRLNLQ
jgi:hypothetical protein